MKKPLIIHPYLFALFPTLFLFGYNIRMVEPYEIFMPISFTVISVCILNFLLNLFVRDNLKSGIVVSVFFVLFFSFGHLLVITKLKPGFFLMLLTALFILSFYYIINNAKDFNILTRVLNISAIFLVSIQLFKITRNNDLYNRSIFVNVEDNVGNLKRRANYPDIYYIILDGYARWDTLKDFYGYDNSEFFSFLISKGFYVADKSFANYLTTRLSLSSSLNMDYIDKLLDVKKEISKDSGVDLNAINKSKVFNFLRSHDYNIHVNLFHPGRIGSFNLSFFQLQLFNTTPLVYFSSKFLSYDFKRKGILSGFTFIEKATRLEGHNFILGHILAPHPPFVFDRYGKDAGNNIIYYDSDGDAWQERTGMDKAGYVRLYTEQLIFVTNQVKRTINTILLSKKPVIIVLQSDHGPGSMYHLNSLKDTCLKERTGILNAYYFPDKNYEGLYNNITPVNTFRLIFNRYLGTEYMLLEDRSYFSEWLHPFKFTDITKHAIDN